MAEKRNCNGCTVCRKIRPTDYTCAWVSGVWRRKHDRPDIVGVIPELHHNGGQNKEPEVWFIEVREGALKSKFLKIETIRNLGLDRPVFHVPLEGNTRQYIRAGQEGFALVFDGSSKVPVSPVDLRRDY